MSDSVHLMPPEMAARLSSRIPAPAEWSVPTVWSVVLFSSMMVCQVLLSRMPVLVNSVTVQRYEVRRKIQHVTVLSILLYCYLYYITTLPAVLLLGSACVFMYGCHRARLVYPDVQRLMIRLFDGLIRPNERTELPGSFWCLLGFWLNACLYSTSITCIALICVTYGDVAASICGKYANRHVKSKSVRGKTADGCVAMFVTCMVTTYIAYAYVLRRPSVLQHNGLLLTDDSYVRKVSHATLMTLSFVASLTATLTERYTVHIDDNLTVQVVTGAVLAVLQYVINSTVSL